jgi:monoamine oxidase
MAEQRKNGVVVVGGGMGGLAAAATLARAGQRVTLLEARDELGGLAGGETHEGFRFDLGRGSSPSAASGEYLYADQALSVRVNRGQTKGKFRAAIGKICGGASRALCHRETKPKASDANATSHAAQTPAARPEWSLKNLQSTVQPPVQGRA